MSLFKIGDFGECYWSFLKEATLTIYYGIAYVSWKSLPVILFNTMANICLSYRLIFTFNEPHACFDNEISKTLLLSHFGRVWLFETLWTVACQAPLYMMILQAGILEWIAMPSSRGSFQPRDGTHISYVSWIGRHVLYHQCHLGSPYPRH